MIPITESGARELLIATAWGIGFAQKEDVVQELTWRELLIIGLLLRGTAEEFRSIKLFIQFIEHKVEKYEE